MHPSKPLVSALALALVLVLALLPLGCSDASTMTLSSPSVKGGALMPDEFTCEGKAYGEGTSPELNWTPGPTGTQSYAILLKDLTIEAGLSAGDMNPEHSLRWTIWNIPGNRLSLSASLPTTQALSSGAQQENDGPPFITPGAYGYFGPCPNLGAAELGAAAEVHDDVFILYAFSDARLTPPAYDPGPDVLNPINRVPQLADFFEDHPSLLGKAELAFTSDATPASCQGSPSLPPPCVP